MKRCSSQADLVLLSMAYLGFISLGLPDTVIGVAWPSVRDTFGRQQGDVWIIFFGAGSGYVLSSFFTGRILRQVSVGVLLAVSSALVGCSGLGYGLAFAWLLFASWSLLHGLGSGAIDAGLNHYVAHHFSARHMNWLHACYSAGAMLGPLIMTEVLAHQLSWRSGYLIVGAILLALSLLFGLTHRRWNDRGDGAPTEPGDRPNAGMIQVLRHPTAALQIVFFFVYTGLEVTLGQWGFTLLTEGRQLQSETAGLWVTMYWGSIAVGRVLFGFVVERLGIDRLLRLSTLASLLGTVLFAFNHSATVSGLALSLSGLGLASIYPNMMSRTQRLGKELAAHAIGFQVSAATLGGSALPSLSGLLAQHAGLQSVVIATVAMALALVLLHQSLLLLRLVPNADTN